MRRTMLVGPSDDYIGWNSAMFYAGIVKIVEDQETGKKRLVKTDSAHEKLYLDFVRKWDSSSDFRKKWLDKASNVTVPVYMGEDQYKPVMGALNRSKGSAFLSYYMGAGKLASSIFRYIRSAILIRRILTNRSD